MTSPGHNVDADDTILSFWDGVEPGSPEDYAMWRNGNPNITAWDDMAPAAREQWSSARRNVFRPELDTRMHKAFVALSTCSHVPAASLTPNTSHSKPGTIEPAGDTSLVVYRKRYMEALDDRERFEVVVDIEAEVASIKKRAKVVEGETDDQRRKRILKDTLGLTPEQVAMSTAGVSAATIKKWRKLEGLNVSDGKRPSNLSVEEKRAEAIRLHGLGRSRYEIAQVVGLHKEQVSRIVLGDRRNQEAA